MEQPLIYVFDDFDMADRIYQEFLANGFDRNAVHLTAREDEAAPVKGNFSVGDAMPDDQQEYDNAFANPVRRGQLVLTVTPVDPTQAQYAIALMARYGVTSPGTSSADGVEAPP